MNANRQEPNSVVAEAALLAVVMLTLLALWPSYRDPGPRTTALSGDGRNSY